jgi:hypothetical protein
MYPVHSWRDNIKLMTNSIQSFGSSGGKSESGCLLYVLIFIYLTHSYKHEFELFVCYQTIIYENKNFLNEEHGQTIFCDFII